MMKYTSTAALVTLGLALTAQSALAYFSPEEVLLNKEYFLPPTARESGDRLNAQQEESAIRRQREQEIIFKQQHSSEAAAPEVTTEHPSADTTTGTPSVLDLSTLSATDMQLLRTMRLLDRIDRNQNVLTYGTRTLGADGALHAGAPLAGTGPAGILAAVLMLGATGATLYRAKRAGKVTQV